MTGLPPPITDDTALPPRTRRTFMLHGAVSAQWPLRWLGLFAQRDLVPETVHFVRSSDRIEACIVQDAVGDLEAVILLEKIRMIPETEAAWIVDV